MCKGDQQNEKSTEHSEQRYKKIKGSITQKFKEEKQNGELESKIWPLGPASPAPRWAGRSTWGNNNNMQIQQNNHKIFLYSSLPMT